jgi:hypothetical protein
MDGATFLASFIPVKNFSFLLASGSSLQNRSRCGSGSFSRAHGAWRIILEEVGEKIMISSFW